LSVGRSTARAAIWAFLSTAGAKAITLVGLAMLARLLAPSEFGLLAFALVYITYADTIGDLGSGVALIYWPDRRDDAAQVTFLISIASGIFWCLSTIALAPAIAHFFNAPHGAPLVQALSFSFLLKYLGNTHDALAQKDLKFRARLLPDISLAAVNAGVALFLAWKGYGAWSLVWGRLAGMTVRTALLWIVIPWRPTRSIPRDLVKPMLRYGRGILIVNILGAITTGADLAVVAHYFNTTALGLYQMAGKIPETTVMVLLWVLSTVLFPAFARVHATGESLRRPYLVVTRYISSVTIPAAVGLAVLSHPIVRSFFGPAWDAAAPLVSALATVAALRCLSAQAGDVLKATGHAQTIAWLSVVKAILIVPALLIGAMYGPLQVALALCVAVALGAVLSLVYASRIIGVTLLEVGKAFFPSVAASAAMVPPLMGWLRWSNHLPAAAQVAGGVLLGGAVFAVVLLLLDRDIVKRGRDHVLNRRRGGDELLREA
jgi:O-antigen/teichoic acid export membrane protein